MLAEPARSSEPRSYDLCVRSDSFRLKHAEVAVTVSDEGIAYELEGRRGLRAFGELESVRILAQSGGENSPWESIIELKFRSGRPLTIHSTSPWGVDDPTRDVAYIAFVEDLHRRIPETERGRIRFLRGASEGRYRFMVGVFVFFLLFFGGAGLFVLSAGPSERSSWLKVLGVLTGIVVFGYAFAQVLRKNTPGTYDPARLPRDIFPE